MAARSIRCACRSQDTASPMSPAYLAAQASSYSECASPSGCPSSRASASARWASSAASGTRPRLRRAPARQASVCASSGVGARPASASRSAVKWPKLVVGLEFAVSAPQPQLRGAPPLCADRGVPGRRGEQSVAGSPAAAHEPPGCQRYGQPQRRGVVVVQCPRQAPIQGSVLGLQQPGGCRLPGTGFEPGCGLFGRLQRMLSQGGGGRGLLAGL